MANILKEVNEQKESVRSLIHQAEEYKWISPIQSAEMISKIDSDTLTVSVIGQMNNGKSTFLNAFVFGDTVLPISVTAMTAALTIITYGEQKKLKAYFYSPDEWAEQKMQAERSLEDAQGEDDRSRIKAAKELVERAACLGDKLESLLGKTQEDNYDALFDYVGANGKYVSITKYVTIFYPMEYLKGVDIVDTPGFNDPIVSREERTKEILKKSDVVIMLLYAGQPFSSGDNEILFKHVRQCGIGKILIGLNKYDIPYCSYDNPKDEDQIKDYVKGKISEVCKKFDGDPIVDVLKDAVLTPLSAEMALLSMLPMNKIFSSEEYKFSWNRYRNNFGISTQREMMEWSRYPELTSAMHDIISSEKLKILCAKPINSIIAIGNSRIAEIEKEIRLTKAEVELLKKPNSQLENIKEDIEKAQKRITKRIKTLEEEIEFNFRKDNIQSEGETNLRKAVDETFTEIIDFINKEFGLFTDFANKIQPAIDNKVNRLITYTLKKKVEDIARKTENVITSCLTNFNDSVVEVINKYLPDLDSNDLMVSIRNRSFLEVNKQGLFSMSFSSDKNSDVLDKIADFINTIMLGIPNVLGNVMAHNSLKSEAVRAYSQISKQFNPEGFVKLILSEKERVIHEINKKFISELIEPLKNNVTEICDQIKTRDNKLESGEQRLLDLQKRKDTLQTQFETITKLCNNINAKI